MMTRSWKLACICSLGVIGASLALAQPGDKGKTPAAKPADGMSMPDPAVMKKMMEDASALTEHHARLTNNVGVWEGKCKFMNMMDPTKWDESACTSTITAMMNGHYTKCEVKGTMKDMEGKMGEMKKGMGGMMKSQGMMKSEDMKGMGKSMGDMSGMMGDMGQMMGSGRMTPEEMENMSKMMGDMSGMMKQMSERMKAGTKKTQ